MRSGFAGATIMGRPAMDLKGRSFSRLTVISMAGPINGDMRWNCLCNCGVKITVYALNLKSGSVKSCGCLRRELAADRCYKINFKHGLYQTPLYHVWGNMKARCLNPNRNKFKNHGGRGITICTEWIDDPEKFIKWALASGWKKGLTLERVDNDKGYSPGNCKLATYKEQTRNMRSNVYVEYNGGKLIREDFISKYAIVSKNAIQYRVKKGCSLINAALTPAGRWKDENQTR